MSLDLVVSWLSRSGVTGPRSSILKFWPVYIIYHVIMHPRLYAPLRSHSNGESERPRLLAALRPCAVSLWLWLWLSHDC
jgi:hypothetical protein